jgi:hypothetical protein
MIFLAVNHEELIPTRMPSILVATSGSFEVLLDDGMKTGFIEQT